MSHEAERRPGPGEIWLAVTKHDGVQRSEGWTKMPLWWDNPTMVITLDAKRRLTVPAALAPARPGDYFDARFDPEEDAIVFRRLGGRENWLAVMKECPVSPDDVPARRPELPKRRKP
jgi:hypothetical protein